MYVAIASARRHFHYTVSTKARSNDRSNHNSHDEPPHDNSPTPPHHQTRRASPNLQNMCRHVLNAQVSIRSPCCKKWFDCAECHAETADHTLLQSFEMVFICKKCKKAFRKDAREFEDRYA